jgi:hypothetical protein
MTKEKPRRWPGLSSDDPISILANGGKLTGQTRKGKNSFVYRWLWSFCGQRGLDMRFWLEIAEGRFLSGLFRESYWASFLAFAESLFFGTSLSQFAQWPDIAK